MADWLTGVLVGQPVERPSRIHGFRSSIDYAMTVHKMDRFPNELMPISSASAFD
jgi:hypothetical protein